MLKIGQKIGSWTIQEGPIRNGSRIGHRCKCVCGITKWVWKPHLVNGNSKSCGCTSKRDLVGKCFGKLIVLKFAGVKTRGNNKYQRTDRCWLCECECGKTTIKRTSDLKEGKISSCGCYLKRKLEIGLSSKKLLFSTYKKLCAKKRGYTFSLEFNEFIKLTSSPCYYCGVKPNLVIKSPRDNGDYIYNGIDRIDNTKGYNLSNVVPCCSICNSAKGDHDLITYFTWLKRTYRFLKDKRFYGH